MAKYEAELRAAYEEHLQAEFAAMKAEAETFLTNLLSGHRNELAKNTASRSELAAARETALRECFSCLGGRMVVVAVFGSSCHW